MKQCMFSLVSALLLAAPITGTAQQQLKPNELTTNIVGVTTIAAPPEDFNPLDASDQDLEYYGFPPRPDQVATPKAFASWEKAMTASRIRVEPILEVTRNSAGPAKLMAGATAPADGSAATSSNWSGYANTNGVTKYGSSSFYYIIGDYVVPVARQAYGKCDGTWDYSITWVGIDGWGSHDVLQAGSEADAYCSGSSTNTLYSAWFEWFPYNWTRIPSLPIAPGDDLFVEVWNTSSTAGHAYLVNYNTNHYVMVSFSAPPGTLLEQDAPDVVEHDQHRALHEIDEAIRVIKDAASEDGKDLNVHPPVQPQLPVSGRFHRALEAIGNAHRDVADREHNESARGLRDEAIQHIDEAHQAVEHAILTASWSH